MPSWGPMQFLVLCITTDAEMDALTEMQHLTCNSESIQNLQQLSMIMHSACSKTHTALRYICLPPLAHMSLLAVKTAQQASSIKE